MRARAQENEIVWWNVSVFYNTNVTLDPVGDASVIASGVQFDTVAQLIGATGIETHFVPGEHGVHDDDGKYFFARFTKGGPRG